MKRLSQEEFEKLSITELKALAYDEISTLENTQKNLSLINGRINQLSEVVETSNEKGN